MGIYEKAQLLQHYPEVGHRYRQEQEGEIRIAYLIKESAKIDILGVFHGALDIDRYLS